MHVELLTVSSGEW